MALLGWGSSSEDEITYNKGMFAYLSGMIAVKPLLVADGSHHDGIPHLLEHVDVCLMLFLSPSLIVEVDAQSIKVEVGGDDRLCLVDEEEGGVAH